MRCAVLAFFSLSMVAAQSSDPALALVHKAAVLAYSAKSWQAAGHTVVEIEGPATHITTETDFHLYYAQAAPAHARNEISVGPLSVSRFCDDEIQWTYVPSKRKYAKIADPKAGACAYPLNEWPVLPFSLRAAAVTGADRVEVNGAARDCRSIRAEFGPPDLKQTRTLCIDPETNLILSYRIDRDTPGGAIVRWSQTTTFRTLERDAPLNPRLFRFTPPESAFAVRTLAELGIAGSVVNAAQFSQGSASMTPPKLIHKVDAEYTQAATDAHVEGSVILSIVIGTDGKARDARVQASLDPELDRSALKAVEQWEFEPATAYGETVPATQNVEVVFRLASGK